MSTVLGSRTIVRCWTNHSVTTHYDKFEERGSQMPGTKYTDKQERKAEHIEESYKKKGVSADEAEKRAWATVNKQDGGGKKPGGSGRKKASE